MIGSSSDDSNDADYLCSKIKSDLIEAQKQDNFDNEEWPKILPSENGTSTGKLPQPCVENILKMIRNSTHAKNTQNGFKETVTPDEFAKICSTIDKRDLESIIGSVQWPQIQQPNVPQPQSQPAPPTPQHRPTPPMPHHRPTAPMPQHRPVQPANVVSVK